MSLSLEKLESSSTECKPKNKKWRKNQKIRKIRRVKQTEIPHIKNKGWEY